MFTGLVQELGTVASADRTGDGLHLVVEGAVARDLAEGDSVAVSGVCLTATTVNDGSFAAHVTAETLRRSSLARVRRGDRLNLELPLRAADRLGGHVVQGHVDGLGEVRELRDEGLARLVTVATDPELLRYVVAKGSIAVDGVSLTVAELHDGGFTVSLVPETLERTSLGAARTGDVVNLEVDVLAKYVERLVAR
ncbi:MAG: riboflavin synthase [Solirubrobacteraceae bacterium]|jgi:riboflavin synthase|nr:riboflavin synthase [Solirubrobacteraceae bacterium]